MALELYRTGDCLAYDQSVSPSRPSLHITIEAPVSRRRVEYDVPVDTGFSGYLLLPQESYSRLSESELPSDYFLTYSAISGRVQLRRARVFLEIFGEKSPSFIETPMMGSSKLLAGRKILANLRLALLGPEAQTCSLSRS